MKQSKRSKLILFGGNRKYEDGPLLTLALHAQKQFDIVIFTDPFRLNLPTKNGHTLQSRLEKNNLKWYASEQLDYELLTKHVNDTTIGLSIGALWFFKQNVIDLFNGNLFNYHNTKLPTERGASAYTWKILSQNRLGGLTIHKIEEKLDVGDIVAQKNFSFPNVCRIQKDYYDYIEKKELNFIWKFLGSLSMTGTYTRIKQKEINSTYWPKIDTAIHGYLNWDWSASDIGIFICAFDDPHPGAITFIDEKKVHLKNCTMHKELTKFHPFQSGLVFKIHDGKLHVAAVGGCLIIERVLDDKGTDITNEIKLGHRFHTPISFLDNAKVSRSTYQDEIKKIK